MTALEARVRERLLARRDQLAALAESRREEKLIDLMRRVDSALGALEVGTWGLCAVCHEAISSQRLEADPLVTVCLECLSEDDRRALERDLEAAARVQRGLMPPPRLAHAGWEIAYLWEPRSAVSGDHVDVVRPANDDGALLLVVGDVAGKGVAASLLQSHLHALFRALAPAECSVDSLLARANHQFAEATLSASYATLAALDLRPDGRAELANAGHPRPLLADERGVRPVEGGGLPLGMFTGSTYGKRELALAPGQTLLVYTDGWTEAERDGEEYGIGRAAAALRRAAALPLPELLAACRADLDAFLAGTPRGDDLTLVAVRREARAT
jgi:sigma-B regulation protein RsbU (phosphoserine phosphatase)